MGIDRYGYSVISLNKSDKSYYKTVHRLVAKAFIDNPNNYASINHRDENKLNNNVNNLEWCTVAYNNRYSKTRKVVQIGIDGKFVREWDCIKDAADACNLFMTHIQSCCARKPHYITYGGYQWRYKEEYDPNFDYAIEKPMKNRGRAVVQYDINGNFIGEYEAICKIPDTTLAQKTIINKICNGTGRSKTCKGCLWKWK